MINRILKMTTIYVGAIILACSTFPTVREKYMQIKNSDNPQHGYLIRLKTMDGRFFCSGFVIDGRYALTAAHCLSDAEGKLSREGVRIFNSDDVDTGIIARPFALNHRSDRGAVSGDFVKFQRVDIDAYSIDMFEKHQYASCGFPAGQKKILCVNILPVTQYDFMVAVKGPLYPGMSGGIVYDRVTKRVVGINSAVMGEFSFITPTTGVLGDLGLE